MFDVKSFLDDYNIPYTTEGKNTQKGWLNIQCPKCEDTSNHGGFNLSSAYYNCWQCGHSWLEDIISALLECTRRKAKEIITEYNIIDVEEKEETKVNNTYLDWPTDTKEILPKPHRRYLRNRNFDPDHLINTWEIRGTGFIGNYKFRIIIPVMLNSRMVSYIGRDITDRALLRYKACEIKNEVVCHKHIVYGADYVQDRKAIIVEGIFDAWRIGQGAVATFGTGFSPQQLIFLSTLLDTAFILYDSDEQAQKEAEKLYYALSGTIDHVEIIMLDKSIKDPAEMKQRDADELRRFYLG